MFRAWMICLHAAQGVLVRMMHFPAGRSQPQDQVRLMGERAIVVERNDALEALELWALQQILVLQDAITGIARRGIEVQYLVAGLGARTGLDGSVLRKFSLVAPMES